MNKNNSDNYDKHIKIIYKNEIYNEKIFRNIVLRRLKDFLNSVNNPTTNIINYNSNNWLKKIT